MINTMKFLMLLFRYLIKTIICKILNTFIR